MLKQNPDYELALEPPDAIAFFNNIRKEEDTNLEPIRLALREEQKAIEASQRRIAELQRKADEDAANRLLSKMNLVPKQVIERRVTQSSTVIALMPFGLGQFQNGKTGLGVMFASTQAASAITSAAAWLGVELLRSPDGTFGGSDYTYATRLNTAKWVAAGLFYALWIAGAIEANVNFVPERVVESPAPPPTQLPLTPAPEQKRVAPPAPRPVPAPDVGHGSGALDSAPLAPMPATPPSFDAHPPPRPVDPRVVPVSPPRTEGDPSPDGGLNQTAATHGS